MAKQRPAAGSADCESSTPSPTKRRKNKSRRRVVVRRPLPTETLEEFADRLFDAVGLPECTCTPDPNATDHEEGCPWKARPPALRDERVTTGSYDVLLGWFREGGSRMRGDASFSQMVIVMTGIWFLILGNPILAAICFVIVWRRTKRRNAGQS